MATVNIKSTHESQGAFVVIEESDFNPEIHEKYVEGQEEELKEGSKLWIVKQLEEIGAEFGKAASKAELKALLDEKLAE